MVHVGVAQENRVDSTFFTGSIQVFEVVPSVGSFQLGEESCEEEVFDAVAFSWLVELGEVFSRLAEAHAEVKEDAGVLVFEEYLVAADLVYTAVERELCHIENRYDVVSGEYSINRTLRCFSFVRSAMMVGF